MLPHPRQKQHNKQGTLKADSQDKNLTDKATAAHANWSHMVEKVTENLMRIL